MSAAAPHRRAVRACIAPDALDIVAARVPADVELIPYGEDADLSSVDFVVPAPMESAILLDALASLERLSVIQTVSAGTDRFDGRVPERVTLCSARGARDAPVAEWAFGALLGASTQLLSRAPLHSWRARRRVEDLSEWRVLIVGMGSIGRLLGEHLAQLGSDVVGVASRARDGVHGVDELPSLLPGADAVVLLTPLTEATRRLIGADELAAMHDGAVLVNAGRGPVVDTDALVAETGDGRLRAVLDVTDPEPLPDGHPLWSAPGVLSITPHIAGDSPRGNRQAAEFAGDQLARWCAGEPLLNVVKH